MSDTSERYVVTEKPRLSAASILLIMMMVMILLQSFMILQMYNTMNQLQQQIVILNSQLKVVQPQLQQLNQRYASIDAAMNIYIQTLVLRMLREMFPNMSEEELRQMLQQMMQQYIYQHYYNVTYSNITSGFIVR